jgi:hypothetical protein
VALPTAVNTYVPQDVMGWTDQTASVFTAVDNGIVPDVNSKVITSAQDNTVNQSLFFAWTCQSNTLNRTA